MPAFFMQQDLFQSNIRDVLLSDLFQAYYDARKNKRNTHSVLAFELHYEHELFRLCDEILNHRYEPLPSICFIVHKPVKREVFAAHFRDRIIHHYIYNQIAPVFENRFVNDSYSCRRKKGTHYGIKRVNHFIRSCSENYHRDCYILKIDIKGYFMSIDRSLLYDKLKTGITEYQAALAGDLESILYLIRQTIFNDPTHGCIMKCARSEWKGLPDSKSLFHAGKNKGLPIGNLTSQLFANIYLDEFDHYVKRNLKMRYYGRYVDDIVIVHRDKEYLKFAIPKIRSYLRQSLMLQLHPKKIYLQHYTKGVAFLGAVIKPCRIYIASRSKGNFFCAVQRYNSLISANEPSPEIINRFLASMNSYLGIFRHYKTHILVETMLKTVLSRSWLKWVSVKGNYAKFIIRK
jgi:retron-type reverse transcriptase